MEKAILIRFGDLVLKGRNKPLFITQIKRLLREKLRDLNIKYEYQHDRIFIHFMEKDKDLVIKQLGYVSGIHSFSYIYKTTKDLDDIAKLAIEVVKTEVKLPTTFKIETKRTDKNYPLQSLQISQEVAKRILPEFEGIKVEVKKPETVLNIEVRHDACYIYVGKIPGLGGYPIGLGGKSLVMLSGGIDSPVAAYLMMKQGIEVELFHFESTPLTPLESVQKVIEISKKLAYFMPKTKIKLHLVPFTKIHEEILRSVQDSHLITIMRRMFYRLAEKYANLNGLDALINGESVGQVASQTLSSIKVVENVTNIPILRPVITNDKQEIIEISKKIDTYDISILPFNDCCSVYVPRNPVTNPTIKQSLIEESKFEFNEMLDEAIKNIQTIIIEPTTDFEIALYGFDVESALKNYTEGK
ncbi:tRNA uracil 4-sulfurtransferase ThiI [Acholeplasma granularum]|uniref:tRNA uracil 4-sulfurtransferase ThiI n=1 Tax=Acholeplasma granularum TaxID=264635 RepID=UPI0004B37F32|nr:tRNA uracil 4-sulfurtransferase ThiI [Acholeplasma granularum]